MSGKPHDKVPIASVSQNPAAAVISHVAPKMDARPKKEAVLAAAPKAKAVLAAAPKAAMSAAHQAALAAAPQAAPMPLPASKTLLHPHPQPGPQPHPHVQPGPRPLLVGAAKPAHVETAKPRPLSNVESAQKRLPFLSPIAENAKQRPPPALPPPPPPPPPPRATLTQAAAAAAAPANPHMNLHIAPPHEHEPKDAEGAHKYAAEGHKRKREGSATSVNSNVLHAHDSHSHSHSHSHETQTLAMQKVDTPSCAAIGGIAACGRAGLYVGGWRRTGGTLGSGTYGSVFSASVWFSGGESPPPTLMCAIKRIFSSRNRTGEVLTQPVVREVLPHVLLPAHPHLCLADAIVRSRSTVLTVMALMSKSLGDAIRATFVAPPPELVRAWLFQLFSAVAHMHRHGMWHRDIKMENILLEMTGQLRLADLGMARIAPLPQLSSADANATANVCTLWTRAWELLDRTSASTQYTERVDIWSVGVVALAIAAGRYVLKFDTETEAVKTLRSKLFCPEDDFSGSGASSAAAPSATNMAVASASSAIQNPPTMQALHKLVGESAASRMPCTFFAVVSAALHPLPHLRSSAEDILKMPYFKGETLDSARATVRVSYMQWMSHLKPMHVDSERATKQGDGRVGKKRRAQNGVAKDTESSCNRVPVPRVEDSVVALTCSLQKSQTLWIRGAESEGPWNAPPSSDFLSAPGTDKKCRSGSVDEGERPRRDRVEVKHLLSKLWRAVNSLRCSIAAFLDVVQLVGAAWDVEVSDTNLVYASALLVTKAHSVFEMGVDCIGGFMGVKSAVPKEIHAAELLVFTHVRGHIARGKSTRLAEELSRASQDFWMAPTLQPSPILLHVPPPQPSQPLHPSHLTQPPQHPQPPLTRAARHAQILKFRRLLACLACVVCLDPPRCMRPRQALADARGMEKCLTMLDVLEKSADAAYVGQAMALVPPWLQHALGQFLEPSVTRGAALSLSERALWWLAPDTPWLDESGGFRALTRIVVRAAKGSAAFTQTVPQKVLKQAPSEDVKKNFGISAPPAPLQDFSLTRAPVQAASSKTRAPLQDFSATTRASISRVSVPQDAKHDAQDAKQFVSDKAVPLRAESQKPKTLKEKSKVPTDTTRQASKLLQQPRLKRSTSSDSALSSRSKRAEETRTRPKQSKQSESQSLSSDADTATTGETLDSEEPKSSDTSASGSDNTDDSFIEKTPQELSSAKKFKRNSKLRHSFRTALRLVDAEALEQDSSSDLISNTSQDSSTKSFGRLGSVESVKSAKSAASVESFHISQACEPDEFGEAADADASTTVLPTDTQNETDAEKANLNEIAKDASPKSRDSPPDFNDSMGV